MTLSPVARLLVPIRRRPYVLWLLLATALADLGAVWWLRTGRFPGALGGLGEALWTFVAFFFQVSLTGVWVAHRRRGFWLRFAVAQGVVLGLTLATDVLTKSDNNPLFYLWPYFQGGLIISALTVLVLRKFLKWLRKYLVHGDRFQFRLMTLLKAMFLVSFGCGVIVPVLQLWDSFFSHNHRDVESWIVLALFQSPITATPYAIARALRKFLGKKVFVMGVLLCSALALAAAIFDSPHAAGGMLLVLFPFAQCILWYSAVRVLRRPKRPRAFAVG